MTRNFAFILLVVVLGFCAAGAITFRRHASESATRDREEAALRLQRDALERVAWIRVIPDQPQYEDEVQGFFKWYFAQVAANQARSGGDPTFSGYLRELDQRSRETAERELPTLPDGRRVAAPVAGKQLDRKAFFEAEKALFDRMRSGKYQPVFSGTDKGLRLDVVTADAQVASGKRKIRFPVVLWGAQRELKEGDQGVRRMATSVEMSATFRLLDDKGKLYGEMSAGNPNLRNDYPERLIPEFPPQMVLGQYEIDPVPAAVSRMELTVAVRSHAPTGGDINALYTWKAPVPDTWKLEPGQAWEGATESIRSQEEIDPTRAARR